jgi:hypothetical protein
MVWPAWCAKAILVPSGDHPVWVPRRTAVGCDHHERVAVLRERQRRVAASSRVPPGGVQQEKLGAGQCRGDATERRLEQDPVELGSRLLELHCGSGGRWDLDDGSFLAGDAVVSHDAAVAWAVVTSRKIAEGRTRCRPRVAWRPRPPRDNGTVVLVDPRVRPCCRAVSEVRDRRRDRLSRRTGTPASG